MARLPLLLAAALVLAGIVRPVGAAGEPFEIPAILSLTGPGSFLGKNEQDALNVVESQVNASGGVAGRPVKFAVQDDQSNPQVALQLTNALIARKVPVILGSTLVAACSAMAPLAKDGPVIYCLSAGMHPEKDGYMFTYGVSTTDLIAMNLRYLNAQGLRKIAILTSTDASGQDGERGIDAGLALPESKGLTVVAREHYATSDLSVAAQLSRIKQSGAQTLIAWGTGTPIGTVLHGVQDIGLDIPICVSASNNIYAEMKQYASILPHDLLAAGMPATVAGSLPRGPVKSAVQQFVDACKAVGVRADISQSIAWDPGLMIVGAFRKLGPNATAAQLRTYIEALHGWAGANGMYDFRTGDQRGLAVVTSGIMNRWDAGKDTWVAISKFGGAIR
jgi:branched-chain amino acid transport system substrate-binding protein